MTARLVRCGVLTVVKEFDFKGFCLTVRKFEGEKHQNTVKNTELFKCLKPLRA
jgi:hypothetical protein